MKYKIIFDGQVKEQDVAFMLRDEFGRDASIVSFDVDRMSGMPYVIIEIDSSIPQGALETLSVKNVPVAEVIPMNGRRFENAMEAEEIEEPVAEVVEDKEETEEIVEESIEEPVVEKSDDNTLTVLETFKVPGTLEIVPKGSIISISKE